MSTIDLHMHTCYSDDGEISPEALIEKCKACHIKIMAIADHNCVNAIDQAQKLAEAAGILYIPAIEIDCTYQGKDIQMLGYGIDYTSPDFETIDAAIAVQSIDASRKMLLAIQKLGFEISEDDMMALAEHTYYKDRWTGEMFAEVLLNKPEYIRHPLLMPYRTGGAKSENPYVSIYWDFFSQGKPCYIETVFPPVEDVIQTIHKNGGKAVFAHPGLYIKEEGLLLHDLIDMGIDGLEAFSSYHSPAQAEYFYAQAMKNHLFVTCGSDFHGKAKPAIAPGGHGSFLPDEEMKAIVSGLIR
jgi:predicted metal-dependent phosphoesterase TrpH